MLFVPIFICTLLLCKYPSIDSDYQDTLLWLEQLNALYKDNNRITRDTVELKDVVNDVYQQPSPQTSHIGGGLGLR